tara:strand:+ start:1799 stop:3769 length:1971 start_codon:yes stop_codon:yes gene_type:complete
MKIIINKSQMQSLSQLQEQEEEILVIDETPNVELIFGSTKWEPQFQQIYFNSLEHADGSSFEGFPDTSGGYLTLIDPTGVLEKMTINRTVWPKVHRGEGWGPNIAIKDFQLRVNYAYNVELIKSPTTTPTEGYEDIEIEKLKKSADFLSKIVKGYGFKYTTTVTEAIHKVWVNKSGNWGEGTRPDCASHIGVINFKVACGSENWSILNYFNGNTKVVAELLNVYQHHEKGNVLFNIDEFTQWIDEYREMLFYGTTPENMTSNFKNVVDKLAFLNRSTQCNGELTEDAAAIWLENWYSENNISLSTINGVQRGCPGGVDDIFRGEDIKINLADGSSNLYQVKPLYGYFELQPDYTNKQGEIILNKGYAKGWRWEVKSFGLKKYPKAVNYLFVNRYRNEYVVFKNENQDVGNGIMTNRTAMSFSEGPVDSPQSFLNESNFKIKLTEQQTETLEKNTEEDRRIRTMLKAMISSAPWLVEEGIEKGWLDSYEPNQDVHWGPEEESHREWVTEIKSEMVEPFYTLYGFDSEANDYVYNLLMLNLQNDPGTSPYGDFKELIIPSPFPFETGNLNVGGSSRQGELEGVYREDIEKVFGPPVWDEPSADNKVQVEWIVKFPDGTYATIYDYKQYDVATEDINYWSIGGNTGLAAYYVKKAMGLI